MDTVIKLGMVEWCNKFCPIPNNDSDIKVFDPYNADDMDFLEDTDLHQIWTSVESEIGHLIIEGFHVVNRSHYYVTIIPWRDGEAYEINENES